MISKNIVMITLICCMGRLAIAQNSFDGHIKNNSLAISPDETIAVVSNSDSPHVLVYDIRKKQVLKSISGFVNPRNIIFHPNGRLFYITDSSLGTMLAVDATSYKITATYPIGAGAFGSAISGNGKTIYINNEAANTVIAYKPETASTLAVITGFANPRQGILISPAGDKVYITNFASDKILIVNAGTYAIEGEIAGFNKIRAISITKDGKTLFAANSGSNEIAVVDIASRKVIQTIAVGREPYGTKLSPDQSLLVSGNKEDHTLSVVDIKQRKVIQTIGGFKEPRQAIVFTKDGSKAYVLNKDLSISVVNIHTLKIELTMQAD